MTRKQYRILNWEGLAVYSGFGERVGTCEDHAIVFPVFLQVPGMDLPKYTARPPAVPSGF